MFFIYLMLLFTFSSIFPKLINLFYCGNVRVVHHTRVTPKKLFDMFVRTKLEESDGPFVKTIKRFFSLNQEYVIVILDEKNLDILYPPMNNQKASVKMSRSRHKEIMVTHAQQRRPGPHNDKDPRNLATGSRVRQLLATSPLDSHALTLFLVYIVKSSIHVGVFDPVNTFRRFYGEKSVVYGWSRKCLPFICYGIRFVDGIVRGKLVQNMSKYRCFLDR